MKKIILTIGLFICLKNINTAQSCVVMTEPPVLNAGMAIATISCQGTSGTIVLDTKLSGEDSGGVWSLSPTSVTSPGAAFDASAGQLTTNSLGAGTYSFVYTVGTGACTDAENVDVLVQNCCSPKICTSVKVTKL